MHRRLKRKGSDGAVVGDRLSLRSSHSTARSSSTGSVSPHGKGFYQDGNPAGGGGFRGSSLTGGEGAGGGGNTGNGSSIARALFSSSQHHHHPHSSNSNNNSYASNMGGGHSSGGLGSRVSSRRISRMRSTGNLASRMLSSRSSFNSRDSSTTSYYYPSGRGVSVEVGGGGSSSGGGIGAGGGGGLGGADGEPFNAMGSSSGYFSAPGGGVASGLNYNSIRIEGEVSDEDFGKSADVLAQIITARQSYKALDKGEEEDRFSEEVLALIKQAEPPVELDFDNTEVGSGSGSHIHPESWNSNSFENQPLDAVKNDSNRTSTSGLDVSGVGEGEPTLHALNDTNADFPENSIDKPEEKGEDGLLVAVGEGGGGGEVGGRNSSHSSSGCPREGGEGTSPSMKEEDHHVNGKTMGGIGGTVPPPPIIISSSGEAGATPRSSVPTPSTGGNAITAIPSPSSSSSSLATTGSSPAISNAEETTIPMGHQKGKLLHNGKPKKKLVSVGEEDGGSGGGGIAPGESPTSLTGVTEYSPTVTSPGAGHAGALPSSASSIPASSFITFQDGFFSFPGQRTRRIPWEKYVEDMRAVYSAIENGPCLSVARMRLTTVAEKFQLYSLLNYEHENNYDEYLKGGVYGSGCKVDNALRLESSIPAPTFLEFIVMTARQYPNVPLYEDPATQRVVTLTELLTEGGVSRPEEMTIGGLGLQPSTFSKKNVSARNGMLDEKSNPGGKFGATLVQCFLSMRGPRRGELFGGLVRSELEQMEYKKQQVLCTERRIPLYGHHRDEVYEVASWIRHQGLHKYKRNRWILSFGTRLPKQQVNSLSIQAKTVEDVLYHLFYPLFMASLYPQHPKWRDVALMLEHTSAISVSTTQRSRTKNISTRAIPPSSVKLTNNPNEYYFFYYYWCNVCTLNGLRRALDLNTFYFTSAVYERPPAFDQLVCGYLLSDVVYHHGLSLQKSWVMQYVYMMSRVGIVLSPLCDNLMGVPYFEHPVAQFFRQGMQVSLSTSSPLHCHHRIDQPLIEEYATLMKLCSFTPQDMGEMARNSILNSNFPLEWKQHWLGDPYFTTSSTLSGSLGGSGPVTDTRSSVSSNFSTSSSAAAAGAGGGGAGGGAALTGASPSTSSSTTGGLMHVMPTSSTSRSSVCPYRLQFRQETIIHEVTLLHLVCTENAARKGRRTTLPLLYPLASMAVEGGIRLPDLGQQFRSSKRPHYVDKRIIFPRITIHLSPIPSQAALTEASELIRQVVMLRRKYIHSYATDVKVEDVFSRAHSFNEKNHEYNNYYGVFVLSKVGHAPLWANFIPTISEFIKDVNTVRRAVTSRLLQRMCTLRLQLLERKFLLHLSMNITNEAGKREEKEWNNRDFFTAHKVDNNILNDAGLNARTLLEYVVEKVTHHGEDVVREENSIPVTLRELVSRYHINMSCITVDELNYQMTSHPDLWALFLSPDNYMQGRYFAELTKQKLECDKEDAFCFSENSLRIYGASPEEWYMLAHWFDRYGMASSHNRWRIALPRNYHSLFKKGVVKNYGEFIDHLFSPLWDISLHPAKDTKFHYFLTHVSGFDCVDEESHMDSPIDLTYPHDWNTGNQPSYATYLYYFWANIASLNKFRASRGLGTFSFRPQCGEFGHSDHLIAGFLLANSINHGVTLAKHPVLEYLYYITQLGVAMSPLSNTAGASPYLSNPFPQFFHRGLNVSLATNQPLYFHFTREPLIEEYSIAAKLWKFEFNDLSEIARNSVRQSGFPHSWKEKALGKRYFLHSTLGNEVRRSRVSNIRVAFRFEAYHSEIDFLDAQLQPSVVQRVPRAMLNLTEERRVVAEAPDNPLEKETKVALEKYLSGLRQHLKKKSAQSRKSITAAGGGRGEGGSSAVVAAAAAAAAAASSAAAAAAAAASSNASSNSCSSYSSSSSSRKGRKGGGLLSSVSSRSTISGGRSSSSVRKKKHGREGGSSLDTEKNVLHIGEVEDKDDDNDEERRMEEEQDGAAILVGEGGATRGVGPSRGKRKGKPLRTASEEARRSEPVAVVIVSGEDGEGEEEGGAKKERGRDGDGTGSSSFTSIPDPTTPKMRITTGNTSSLTLRIANDSPSSSGIETAVEEEASEASSHCRSGGAQQPSQLHSSATFSIHSSSSLGASRGSRRKDSRESIIASSMEEHPSHSPTHEMENMEGRTQESKKKKKKKKKRSRTRNTEKEANRKSSGGEMMLMIMNGNESSEEEEVDEADDDEQEERDKEEKKGTKKEREVKVKGVEEGKEEDPPPPHSYPYRRYHHHRHSGMGESTSGFTDPALMAAAHASVTAAAAALRTPVQSGGDGDKKRKKTITTVAGEEEEEEEGSEDNRVLLEGTLSRTDLLTTKKFLQHDIRSLQYRIEELQTCMCLLAESNNRMAEEVLLIMNRRLAMKKGAQGVRIQGQLEHKEGEEGVVGGEEDPELLAIQRELNRLQIVEEE